ncbi:MAG: aspartate kinase [Candidatus Melainabacteria bacterium]|nr:aspartate kinase [Candidatus Melainabacteria bacterium]
MSILVLKFGGSSVADAEKIRRVARIVADHHDKGYQVVTVVSAMGKTTDGLVELARSITENPSGREYDALLATGEMVTTALLAMTLNSMGYAAVGLNGQQAGVRTEDLYNRARVLAVDTEQMHQHLNNGKIVVVTGFQGINSLGEFTTLGRGGSDTSAVALAGALQAERCDIYTDVRGVFSTDPRTVPEAVKLNTIAYIEMMELARLGAKVLHPRAVETARQANVAVCVRSTFDLEDCGTMVVGEHALETDRRVAGVACDVSQARVAIVHVPDQPGVAARIFGKLASQNVSVDMIIQSLASDGKTNDIAFTIGASDLADALTVMEKLRQDLGGTEILVDSDIAKVSIVGVGMIDRPGIAADMFEALADASINIKMISTSEIKISCLVEKSQATQAVQAIHRRFFDSEPSEAFEAHLVNERVGY